MLRRTMAALAVAAAGAAFVPGTALAEHCDDTMVVFSGLAGAPKINSNAGLCLAAGEDAGDTRIINPGSNEISLRYTEDFGAGTTEITAIIDGLGFDNRVVTLTRAQFTTGEFVYNSAAITLDPSQVGCLTAVLAEEWGGANNGETAFHTVGSSC